MVKRVEVKELDSRTYVFWSTFQKEGGPSAMYSFQMLLVKNNAVHSVRDAGRGGGPPGSALPGKDWGVPGERTSPLAARPSVSPRSWIIILGVRLCSGGAEQ